MFDKIRDFILRCCRLPVSAVMGEKKTDREDSLQEMDVQLQVELEQSSFVPGDLYRKKPWIKQRGIYSLTTHSRLLSILHDLLSPLS